MGLAVQAACLVWALSPAVADVTDLIVTESGDDVVVTWTTGSPPWRVLRSKTPGFLFDNALLAQGLSVSAFTDVGAADPSHSYYYLVLEDSQSNPPGFELNPPRPIPFITTLTPDSGVPGDTITITGGNFDPEGGSMVVTFDGEIADILTFSATELTAMVPDGALTGDVRVCRGPICSNGVLFKILVPGPAFQDISSIAFEPGTGSLWVADRGTVDTVYEIEASGMVFGRGNLNQPVLGHPSPGDGNGRIYFSNSLNSQFNVGDIEYINSATNTQTFFDFAGESAGNTVAVRCEGIAANDAEPDVAYFLDGRGETVRRIMHNAVAHDLMYGNQPFPFNSPAGARFDSSGNLYLSSVDAIYKILPQEAGVELVADGFTAAAGIDLSEETGLPMLLVADEATGDIWLVNGESGDKERVGSGFAGPVGVAFSEDLATGDLFYDVAEPTRILRLPDPRVQFLEGEENDVRILLSKFPTSPDSYPSANQTQDAQIDITVRLAGEDKPAGTPIYFRLFDPKDPSGYLMGGAAHPGDNLPTSPGGSVTPSAVVGADGTATVTLTVDPQYVGNNYEIQASLEPPPDFKKIAKTKKNYTSWRRLYIEHDKMYRQGEFLTQTSGAGQPEPARVFVANPGTFAPGDAVHVLSGDSIQTAVGEFRTVAAVGPGYVDLDSPLTLTYPEPGPPPNPPAPYSFLARTAGGVFDAHPSADELANAFDDGFTEWFLLPDTGFIPHWASAEGGIPNDPNLFIAVRSFAFFRNYHRTTQPAMPFTNHIQLVSASRFEASPSAENAMLGLAEADNQGGEVAANWSWIFVDTIDLLAPENVQNLRNHVTAHELGHQLNVNQGSPVGSGHDIQNYWGAPPSGCDPDESGPNCCLMHQKTILSTSGVRRFHANLAAPSQDLLCIRTHVDDLNQDECPPFSGATP